MDLLSLSAKAGLWVNNTHLLIVTFLMGFFLLDRKLFTQAFMLLLFTLVYNFYLKSLWQIPLKPPLQGWAFPSGHMHAGWVFWGWLALHYKKIFTLPIFALIMGLAAHGLTFHEYHDMNDLYGSMAFGSLSLLVFYLANHIIPILKDNLFVLNVLLGGVALTLICLLPIQVQSTAFIWQAQGALMGMAIGWLFIVNDKVDYKPFLRNSLFLLLTVLGMAILNLLFQADHANISAQNFHFIKMFFMMLWVLCSQRLLSLIAQLPKMKFD